MPAPRRAPEAEPGSILVWLQLANAASTPEELATAIQRASALAEGATEAERLLLGIQQSLVDNDTDEALKLAERLTALAPARRIRSSRRSRRRSRLRSISSRSERS